MKTVQKRKKRSIYQNPFQCSVSDSMKQTIDDFCEKEEVTESELGRRALALFFNSKCR